MLLLCVYTYFCLPALSFIILISITGDTRSSSHWDELQLYKDHPEFSETVAALPNIVKNCKSSATNKKYDSYFMKFKSWCSSHHLDFLPASVPTVVLFLGSIIQQKVSSSVLDAYFYSISWHHSLSLFTNPCQDKFISLILEGGKRMLSGPINKKEPITKDILLKLVRFYKQNCTLLNLRTCAMCLLGFSGFLRFNELSNIRLSDLSWHDNYLEIKITKSKTDIYRRGNSIIIGKTGNELCPLFWLNKYISEAGFDNNPDNFLFTAVNYFKSIGSYKATNTLKSLSYTRCREILLSALEEVGLDSSKYALHSLRSGGASTAANNNVPDRLLKVHGRWSSDRAKDGYIKDSLQQKILVSLNLGL